MDLNFTSKTPEELMMIYVNSHPEAAQRAFNELFARYSDRVFFYVLKKVKVKADAEDICQKIFLKLHESKHLFDQKFKFEQWIFVIAKTSVIDAFRKRASDVRKIEALISEKDLHLPISIEESKDLKVLEGLESEKAKLLQWKYVDEMTYEEISKIMNKSESSLRKMMSRIILKLKNDGVV